MEVVTTIFPYTAWKTSFIHSAFENCAATISGVETAYRALKKHGELPVERDNMNFIAFGGDGGTYDIGMATLSAAAERNEDVLYVGTDDGALWMTSTGGHEWVDLFDQTVEDIIIKRDGVAIGISP